MRFIPRGAEYRYYYKCLERYFIGKKIQTLSVAVLRIAFNLWGKEAVLRLFIGGNCFASLEVRSVLSHCTIRCTKKYVGTFYPIQRKQSLDDDLFFKMFRFRREHFCQMLTAMKVLRRMGFPCKFVDLVNIFGLLTNRICDVYHFPMDFLYFKFARKPNWFEIWKGHFPSLAQAFRDFGAPYDSLASIFDGHNLVCCRPGGLGNLNSRLDQGQFFSGEKANHSIKFMVAQFPNGMTTLSGPYKGSSHDSKWLRESLWTEILDEIFRLTGRRFSIFGDTGFLSYQITFKQWWKAMADTCSTRRETTRISCRGSGYISKIRLLAWRMSFRISATRMTCGLAADARIEAMRKQIFSWTFALHFISTNSLTPCVSACWSQWRIFCAWLKNKQQPAASPSRCPPPARVLQRQGTNRRKHKIKRTCFRWGLVAVL